MNEYKPEIDGLRAIAVVLVLLSHVQLGITGGFIGVDVFFVISGFLITSIIISGIEQNNFSFIQFYGRRFVRLYPALIVVVALTFLASFILSDPAHLETTARSGKYVLASISNIYFSKNLGYFDTAASQQPFLHTWTLGVEWQFYLLAPLIIWILLKHSKEALMIGLAVLVGVSVVLSQVQLSIDPNQAYYLMPYRAFELGIGSLLVFIYQRKCPWLVSVLLTLAGLGMILAAGILYSPQTPFPGYAALLPTIGAALCIYGGQNFVKGNLLRLTPVVYIGKISYSVYLVHWPLIVFWKYVLVFREITLYDKLALFVLSLILGAILYKLVETKITWKRLKRKAVGCAGIFMVCLVLVIGANWIQKHIDALNFRISFISREEDINNYFDIHQLGDLDGSISVAILIGDSLGGNYALGIDHTLQDSGYFMYSAFRGGCYMIDHEYVFNAPPNRLKVCEYFQNMSDEFISGNNLPIIYAMEWLYKYDLIDVASGENLLFDIWTNEYREFIRERLEALRTRMGNRKLILIGSPPYLMSEEERITWVRKSCLSRPTFLIDVCGLSEGRDYLVSESDSWAINQMIREFAQTHPNTYYIDPSPVICPDGVCNTRRNDEFYRPNDMNHFSVEGSRKVTPYIWQEIERILNE